LDSDRPSLMLVEDEPVLLAVMGELLHDAGYGVVRVESGFGAIAILENEDFDVIVSDWHMDGGDGAELYRWILSTKPHLVGRIVFLSSGEADDDASKLAPGRPLFHKGKDSQALNDVIREIARQSRASVPNLEIK